jgi:predicted anti-sigma-YlaC factor YlaD
LPAWLLVASLLLGGCSVRRIAIKKLGDALAGSGSTFAADDDPDLIKGAAPFSLKLMESLLAETPRHQGLLLATASGFTQYAYAFVQEEADELEEKDYHASSALRERARRLYLRARNYGLRGLEVSHAGWESALRSDPKAAVQQATKKDVPFMYWTAAAWASLISLSKDQPEVVADLPIVEALIDRALELDESFDQGALHGFLISYELARASGEGDPVARSRRHFDRAMELSRGGQAAPLVSLAESVSVKTQNVAEFKALLNRALAIKLDAQPENRLVNAVMQRRAKWLLARTGDLFLDAEPEKAK